MRCASLLYSNSTGYGLVLTAAPVSVGQSPYAQENCKLIDKTLVHVITIDCQWHCKLGSNIALCVSLETAGNGHRFGPVGEESALHGAYVLSNLPLFDGNGMATTLSLDCLIIRDIIRVCSSRMACIIGTFDEDRKESRGVMIPSYNIIHG